MYYTCVQRFLISSLSLLYIHWSIEKSVYFHLAVKPFTGLQMKSGDFMYSAIAGSCCGNSYQFLWFIVEKSIPGSKHTSNLDRNAWKHRDTIIHKFLPFIINSLLGWSIHCHIFQSRKDAAHPIARKQGHQHRLSEGLSRSRV